MNSTLEATRVTTPCLGDIALAAIAATFTQTSEGNESERSLESQIRELAAIRPVGFSDALEAAMEHPSDRDQRLIYLGIRFELKIVELLAIAVAIEVEFDPLVGRIISHIQSPIAHSRPTLGLLKHAFDRAFDSETTLPNIVNGAAQKTGLLQFVKSDNPLPERVISIPLPLCMALRGYESSWPKTKNGIPSNQQMPLPHSVKAKAKKHALALDSTEGLALIIRCGSFHEAQNVANEVALQSGREALFIEGKDFAGLGPWLLLQDRLPIFIRETSPGEQQAIPELIGYQGPIVAIAGPDGAVIFEGRSPTTWTLEVPTPEERQDIWNESVPNNQNLNTLAIDYRHGAGRIAHLCRLARHRAAIDGRDDLSSEDIHSAAWSSEGEGLDSLALPLRSKVGDDALIASPELQRELKTLLLRCRLRDSLDKGLGASARTSYRSGVRTLFTGPSGTGKTLAAGWIATQLRLPLYRVDLSSVTSKYIGETEKNLSKLLARAEQADVILLFDEADALFGKRTDVNDANDRYANAQTNYLLQRIENYDGIIVLTSNSQSRFDSAFARRLDFIIDFPAPGPCERRRIWQSHLGEKAQIYAAQLNDLAALVDVSGGHIRNIVLAASARAKGDEREISFEDVALGVASEFRKLGRQIPLRIKSANSEESPAS